MSDDQSALRAALQELNLNTLAEELAEHVRQEILALRPRLRLLDAEPRLTQVRGLANALHQRRAEDTPDKRLARLHELVADRLDRAGDKPPEPIVERIQVENPDKLPKSFWRYVAGRLAGLRAEDGKLGQVDRFWAILRTKYSLVEPQWPETLPAAERDQLHLRLAQEFVNQLVETWEYGEAASTTGQDPAPAEKKETTDDHAL